MGSEPEKKPTNVCRKQTKCLVAKPQLYCFQIFISDNFPEIEEEQGRTL